jgi:hypothetical protein
MTIRLVMLLKRSAVLGEIKESLISGRGMLRTRCPNWLRKLATTGENRKVRVEGGWRDKLEVGTGVNT